MLFNSYIFILLFLPIVLTAWWSLARWPQIRLGFLVASSYLFYGWWQMMGFSFPQNFDSPYQATSIQSFQPRWSLGAAIALNAMLVVCILRFDAESPFLYFQF